MHRVQCDNTELYHEEECIWKQNGYYSEINFIVLYPWIMLDVVFVIAEMRAVYVKRVRSIL